MEYLHFYQINRQEASKFFFYISYSLQSLHCMNDRSNSLEFHDRANRLLPQGKNVCLGEPAYCALATPKLLAFGYVLIEFY